MMSGKNILWATVIGSHMWNMHREDSDVDVFCVFAYPTTILLMGYRPKSSFFVRFNGCDVHIHEIETYAHQLIKGNLNYILGTISDVVIVDSEIHKKFRELVLKNPFKGIYHSIRGMAIHNYKKYIKSGVDTSENRCNKILRVLQFGITLLKYGKYETKPFYNGTPDLVAEKINELDLAYADSKLPEKLPESEIRKLLYDVRMRYMWMTEDEK